MHKLVLIRHGESAWNKENRFTGWTDVDLTDKGREEAREAGRLMKAEGFSFDIAYVSVLRRALTTLWLALDEMDELWIPVEKSWRLNERHYGALQGLNKAETAAKFGDDQVLVWRRSYDIPPPVLEKSDERWPGHDPRYKNIPEAELPVTECLKDTVARFCPSGTRRSPRSFAPAKGHHRRAWQQPPRAREVPRQRLGRGNHQPQHPDRRAARLRTRRRAQAHPPLLPR